MAVKYIRQMPLGNRRTTLRFTSATTIRYLDGSMQKFTYHPLIWTPRGYKQMPVFARFILAILLRNCQFIVSFWSDVSFKNGLACQCSLLNLCPTSFAILSVKNEDNVPWGCIEAQFPLEDRWLPLRYELYKKRDHIHRFAGDDTQPSQYPV